MELNDFEINEYNAEEKEEFKIENIEQATWALRKLSGITKKENEIKGIAEMEVDRIGKWELTELNKLESSREYFERIISDYYIEQKTIDPKYKLNTPYGKVSTRKNKKWNYINEKETIQYLKDNNIKAVKVTESIDKKELKSLFKDGINPNTGDIIPGIDIVQEENITIKPEGV